MSHSIGWIDRLRIERLVWSLDQQLYDLPRRSRISTRREVRENLLTAARDIGTSAALRNVGSSTRLAREYLAAQFGDQLRPSWTVAALFLLTGQLVFTALLGEAALAFGDGIRAADPAVSGTVTYTFVDGSGTSVGGAWTPLAWALWIGATIVVGRLWRVVPMWRHRHDSPGR